MPVELRLQPKPVYSLHTRIMSSESEKDETIPERPPEAIWCERYEHIVQVMPHERLERYAPGGFHPVALGDTFCNGRYTVRHKLGHGGYSTVWLARDRQEKCEKSCLCPRLSTDRWYF